MYVDKRTAVLNIAADVAKATSCSHNTLTVTRSDSSGEGHKESTTAATMRERARLKIKPCKGHGCVQNAQFIFPPSTTTHYYFYCYQHRSRRHRPRLAVSHLRLPQAEHIMLFCTVLYGMYDIELNIVLIVLYLMVWYGMVLN